MRVLLAVLLLSLTAAAPASACNASKHLRAAKKRGPGAAPLAIGDSTMLGAVTQISRAGLEVDARGCRQMSSTLDLLRQRKRAGRLPRIVAIMMGTNGTVTVGQIGAAVKILGRERLLVMVTPRETGNARSADQTAVRRSARRFPGRVRVLDWYGYSQGKGGWFAGDGIHLGVSGARGLARLLSRVFTFRAPVKPPC